MWGNYYMEANFLTDRRYFGGMISPVIDAFSAVHML